ncbi:MAG: type II secretion system F family protein [Thermogemmata sp.]|jgi:type IV pilus assembly protein PilC|uniref:Type II secretion system F family protein n=1 Tax=Thermogemmata fonticola TaxID=2755323 RepID=A0A7V9AB92_9BACT|nr:type II secretion system F family protein [Thermogemmata fonticola]MBA2225966.1 type II secretion system F family protein [Thermogemmata fonticola]MCX8139293.1 type II secretion system F family protein [Gemmataceae bacterium]
MPTYKFEALDASGNEIKDSIEAANEEEAQAKVKSRGYFVTKLAVVTTGGKAAKGKKKKTGKSRKTFTIGRVKQKMLVTFTRQFSTLIDAGLPVLRSLRILERQMKPSVLKNALIDIVDDVESGSSLSDAMAKQPKCFSKLYVNMVKAGEAGGALEVILQRLADFLEKAQSLKGKIIGAMVYPAVVIAVAIGILTFIMVAIIPKFKKIFDEFGMTLPWATQKLIAISNWMSEYWWTIPLFPMGLYLLAKLLRLTRWGNYALDRALLWIPIIGELVEKTIVARTMRTLGTLVSSGVPILEALTIVKETSNNAVFERMFQRVFESVREGDTIADPMRESRLVDDMVVNMIEVGEETGDLDTMLYKIADFYDEWVDNLVKSLLSLLEPIMIVFLGFTIGAIVISLFLPLIKLLEGLSKSG